MRQYDVLIVGGGHGGDQWRGCTLRHRPEHRKHSEVAGEPLVARDGRERRDRVGRGI